MFFNKKAKYKNNFLAMAVPSTIAGYYQRYEYSIYDALKDLYESKGAITEADVISEIKRFRELIANTLVDALDKEYKEASEDTKEIITTLRSENYENMQEVGPTITCVYITIAKCVLGEEGKDVKIDEVAEPVLRKLSELEKKTIQTSIDILIEDGIVDKNFNIGGI